MKKLTCFIFVAALLLMVSPSFAGIWGQSVSDNDDLHDGRSFDTPDYAPPSSEGGLSGSWPSDFTIHWDIDQDALTSVWTYQYTLSSTMKDISHFILELTAGGSFTDYAWGDGAVELGVWDGSHGQSDPGWPGDASLYGVKFDYGSGYVTYTLQTTRSPVWGNFYVKSGKDAGDWVYAYNNALALEGFNSNNRLDFIVRPDGGVPPVVPEPASALLFMTGGAVVAFRRIFRRR